MENKDLEKEIYDDSFYLEQKLSYMLLLLKQCRMFYDKNHKYNKAKHQIIRVQTLELINNFKNFRKKTNQYNKIKLRMKNGS